MSDVAVSLRWRGSGLVLDATTPEGLQIALDSKRIEGASPPQLLLIALAGCTSIDIVDIATKMRVSMAGLEIAIEGDRAPEPPRRYTAIRATYRVSGVDEADRDKVRRALALSEEKYCSIRHSLAQDIEFSSTLEFV